MIGTRLTCAAVSAVCLSLGCASGADPERTAAVALQDAGGVRDGESRGAGAARATAERAVHPSASLVVDVEPQTGLAAPFPDLEALGCDSLSVRSPFTGANAVHVFATGVEGVTAVQFGIRYPETVTAIAWRSAGPGIEIPAESWPASGSWVAVAYGEALPVFGGLSYLGTLSLAPGSRGVVELIGVSEDEGLVKIVDADRAEWIVGTERLAVAAVQVVGGRQGPCD